MTAKKLIKTSPAPSASKRNAVFLVAAFLTGLAAGYVIAIIRDSAEKDADYFHLKRIHFYHDGGHLIDPVIQVEDPQGHDARLEALKGKIKTAIDEAVRTGDAEQVSVCIRDLKNFTWIGINENEKYSSASLGKVPLLFTLFLKAQKDPAILKKPILYAAPILTPKTQSIVPQDRLRVGQAYTVEELMRDMIIYSDNVATILLLADHDVDPDMANRIFSDLQLPTLSKQSTSYLISAKDYATFFRILYRASYLSKELSERALRLLSESNFNDGIVSGVPRDILVAHKFGESGDETQVQLHDCGIVYCAGNPYLICVMTKGKDFSDLEGVIRSVSKIAYQHFSQYSAGSLSLQPLRK